MSYGLPPGTSIFYGAPGFPDWVYRLGDAFGLRASTYPGHQESDRNEAGYAPNPQHLNRAIDWAGPADAMQRFADYLMTIKGALEQVIWENPQTGQRAGVAGGRDVTTTGYYASDYSGHRDHVHTRQSDPIPLPGVVPSGITGDALAEAWGRRAGVDYNALAPGCNEAMIRCGATTVNKSAMFLAQLGHESGGGYWREEIASGQAYEGRIDLGNTQPGDGQRFKGRSFVQVTGRAHYLNLSIWAHAQGYVPTPTFFIDNPSALANAEYVWLGAVWYFLTQRPGFMDAAERGDLETCTRMVNGGLNGLDDRRNYWNRARAMGDRILPALATPADPFEELLMSDLQVESLSIYATPGEPLIPIVRMVQSIDAADHRRLVEDAARLGDGDSLRRILRTAKGEGKFRDTATINHARAVLADIERTNPAVLQGYLAKNGASK